MTGLLTLSPQRRADRAPGKDGAVCRDMAQDHPFPIGGKDHIMFANNVTAPDGGKTDGPAFPCAGDAVAA